MRQRWSIADHAQVAYEVDLEDPVGHRGPAFRGLSPSKVVTTEEWDAAWNAEGFQAALATGDVDGAWVMLSDAAEDLLTEQGAVGVRRSAPWRPVLRAHPRSRADGAQASLLVVRLRRLQRRVAQLAHRPDDRRLRAKAAKLAGDLERQATWLEAMPYFEMERWTDWLEEHIQEEESQSKVAAIAAWRGKMDASEPRLLSWIKRREDLNVEMARPLFGCWRGSRVQGDPSDTGASGVGGGLDATLGSP